MGSLEASAPWDMNLSGLVVARTDDVRDVVGIELRSAYADKFVALSGRALHGANVCLAGDTAISHHLWPGQGLNTSLKAAEKLRLGTKANAS